MGDTVLQELLQHGPFHRAQSFSSIGAPWATTAEHLVLYRLLSHRSQLCRDPAPDWALPELQLPLGCVYLLQPGVPRGLQCGYLLHIGPPWAPGWQPAFTWSCLWAAREFLLWHLSTSSPSLLLIWRSAGLFLFHFFLTPLSWLLHMVLYNF